MAQIERHHTIYERWRGGALVESSLEPMALRYWGLEEMTMTLRDTGYDNIVAVGNFDRRRAPRSGDRRSYRSRRPEPPKPYSAPACSTGPESRPLAATSRSTNSITAMAALSPWRKPALSTRM